MPVTLQSAGITDPGGRPNNEDAWIGPPKLTDQQAAAKGYLYIVADGIGGHESGEVASSIAVQVVRQRYYADPNPDVAASLSLAIQSANREIYRQSMTHSGQHNMGTTLTAVVVRGSELYIANVGDSRVYRVGDGHIQQLTRDHTWVAERVEKGILTREEAARHPQRNVITRSLGEKMEVIPDIFADRVKQGDRLLLCSDGLSDVIQDPEMAQIVLQRTPQQAARALVALAKQRDATDNITVVIAGVGVTQGQPLLAGGRGAQYSRWAVALLALAVVFAVIVFGSIALRAQDTAVPPPATVTSTSAAVVAVTPSPTPAVVPALTIELREPQDNQKIVLAEDQPIKFAWHYSEGLNGRAFELFIDGDGSNDVIKRPVADSFHLEEGLPPGDYTWTVRLATCEGSDKVEGEDGQWACDHGHWQVVGDSRSRRHFSVVAPTPTPVPPTLTPVPPTPTATQTPTPSSTPDESSEGGDSGNSGDHEPPETREAGDES